MVDNDLGLELAAMQVIASALGRLDPSARTRVLHWLQARFDDAVPAAATPVAARTAPAALRIVHSPASDEMLSVETLNDLFDPLAAPAPEAALKPVTGLLTEFVAEFQNLAREWDGACDATAEAHRRARLLSAAS